jgi:hypothetical protein
MSDYVALNAHRVISSASVVAYMTVTTPAKQLTSVYIIAGIVRMIPRHAVHRTFPCPWP